MEALLFGLVTFLFIRSIFQGSEIDELKKIKDQIQYPSLYLNQRFQEFVKRLVRMENIEYSTDENEIEKQFQNFDRALNELGEAVGYKFQKPFVTEGSWQPDHSATRGQTAPKKKSSRKKK